MFDLTDLLKLGILLGFGFGLGYLFTYLVSYLRKYVGEPEEDELTRRKKAVIGSFSCFITLVIYWFIYLYLPGIDMLQMEVLLIMLVIVAIETGGLQFVVFVWNKFKASENIDKKIAKTQALKTQASTVIKDFADRIKKYDVILHDLNEACMKEQSELLEITKPEPDPIAEDQPQPS